MQLLERFQDNAGCDNFIADLFQKAEGLEEVEFVLGCGALPAHEGEEVALLVPNDEQHEVSVSGFVLVQANGAAPVAIFCRKLSGFVELCEAPGAPVPMAAPGWRPFAIDAAVDNVAVWVQL